MADDGTESPWSEGFGFSVGDVSVTYTLTIDTDNFDKVGSDDGYTPYNGEHAFTATATDGSNKTDEIILTSNAIMPTTNNTYKPSLQWQASNGALYNTDTLGEIISIEISYASGSNTTFTVSAGDNSSTLSTVSGSNNVYAIDGKGFFKISKGASAGYTKSVTITYKK